MGAEKIKNFFGSAKKKVMEVAENPGEALSGALDKGRDLAEKTKAIVQENAGKDGIGKAASAMREGVEKVRNMTKEKIGEEKMETAEGSVKEGLTKARETFGEAGGKVFEKAKSLFRKGKSDAGYVLLEILAGLFILAVAGYAVMGQRSSTSSTNQSQIALTEAEALETEVQGMYPNGYYVPSGDISSQIVTQQATPANMLNGGCSTGLCGPFTGSSWTVIPNGTTVTETLTPTTIQQCSSIIESAAGSGLFISINGLSINAAITPADAQSACGSGSISFVFGS